MSNLTVKKTENYISEYADTSYSFSLGADANCTINFMKFAPILTVPEGSLLVDQKVTVHPELFATISLHPEHARNLAHMIIRTLDGQGS